MSLFLTLLGGLFTWSFLEYAIHNWFGHLPKGKGTISKEHLAHHADTTYFVPWPKKLLLAAVVLSGLWLVGSLMGTAWQANLYISCLVLGWLGYEWLHRRLHTHAPRTAFGRWARRNHFHHHFASPQRNHGVSSPLWDLVFRTYERPGLIRVPERQLTGVVWLTEPGTRTVKPAYAADYAIGTPPHRRQGDASQLSGR
jgi:sterol desaturase/sphingolipid hydroxylase (fatty acid hydroxylase superfamily)